MKLLVLDVEGTIFRTHIRLPGAHIDSTIWQGIAHRLGEAAIREEVATQDRWANGEYRSYLDWMRDTIVIHQRHGLTSSVFRELIDAAEYNPHVLETLNAIDRERFEPVMISGGFRELTARAQCDLGIVHAFAACEYFFDREGLLRTFNLLPCDFYGKIDFIHLMLREYGLGREDWVFIGDGANDVPIAQAAPLSIGYRPHPKLREVVTHAIDDFSQINSFLT